MGRRLPADLCLFVYDGAPPTTGYTDDGGTDDGATDEVRRLHEPGHGTAQHSR